MLELERKLEEAGAHLSGDWSEARIERVSRAMVKRGRRRAMARAGVAAILVVAGSVAGPLALRGPSLEKVRFADGSTATPRDRNSVLRTAEDSPQRVVAELVRGGARFEVTDRLFRLEAGQVAIEAVESVFEVERRDEGVRVTVERGQVRALQNGEVRTISAGNEALLPSLRKVVAPPIAPEPIVTPPPASPSPTSVIEPPRPKHTTPAHPPVTHPAKASWTAPAEQGDFDKAYEELSKSGPQAVRDLPAELLLAADVTRLSHHPSEAVPLLERVVRDHAGDPRAPLAAFTLGRVLLDELGRPQQAAGAFGKARSLEPNGPLAADALAREVEAWSRAGDTARARAQAEEYLRRFPKGARSSSVRRFGGLE
jgi:transmembrane sensor